MCYILIISLIKWFTAKPLLDYIIKNLTENGMKNVERCVCKSYNEIESKVTSLLRDMTSKGDRFLSIYYLLKYIF